MLTLRAIPPSAARGFWTALVQCHCGFLVLTALLSPVAALATAALRDEWPLALLPFIMLAWWWISLCRAISARAQPGPRLTAVCLLIPFLSLMAAIVGLLPAALIPVYR